MALWDWWEATLTESQRDRLMAAAEPTIDQDLAVELRGGGLLVIESAPARCGSGWQLRQETADFVAARNYDRCHPDED